MLKKIMIASIFMLPTLSAPVSAKTLPSYIHVTQRAGINTAVLTFNIEAPATTNWNEKECKHFFSLSTRNNKLITSAATKLGDNVTEEFDTPIGDGNYISTNNISVTVERNGHQEKGVLRVVQVGHSAKEPVSTGIGQWVFISEANKGLPTCQGSGVTVEWAREKKHS